MDALWPTTWRGVTTCCYVSMPQTKAVTTYAVRYLNVRISAIVFLKVGNP